jgi:hypothetical protein
MKLWDYLRSYDGLGIFNRWWWRDFWYNQISARLRPRNKWLTKKIPRQYRDKDTILELCVLESLKHYIEGEEALGKDMCHFQSSQEDPSFPEWQKEKDREVKHYYELTTQKLVSLQKELDEAWDNVPRTNVFAVNVTKCDYEATYGDVNRLEKEIHDLKTEIMVWTIRNRDSLWT